AIISAGMQSLSIWRRQSISRHTKERSTSSEGEENSSREKV
ncbi:hypothetical protein CCACVL1_23780, partial [Corchorus capsularis]